MSDLSMLNMNLIIVEDVMIYLEFLETPLGQFSVGHQKYGQVLARIDIRARQRDLAGLQLYAPFCKESGSGEV